MKYKIVEGLPSAVEQEVQLLLANGWELNGQLFPRIHDGYHLVVQGMVSTTTEETEEKEEAPVNLIDLIKRVTTDSK